ncbi:MAG: SDR family NAD(P)-dependent oxidoreductase [Halieaceae bacterium]
MQDFAGKVAIVTGAASGIGLALATVFAEQKMKIVLADIEPEALAKAVAQIQGLGVEAIGVVTDVGDDASVAALAKEAVDTFGAIHIACNNAGVYAGGLVWEQTEADFEWVMRVNQWGIIHGIRHFVPQMLSQGDECHVVNTASMAGMTTLPFAGIYHMTKHAALALSECLFHELALTAPQVGVSCLCPELIATNIGQSQRNRPTELADTRVTESSEMVHQAIIDATDGALSPRVMAERVLQGIIDNKFYLCPPPENPWHASAKSRMEDCASTQNPRFATPPI